jgi:hypothetical protein
LVVVQDLKELGIDGRLETLLDLGHILHLRKMARGKSGGRSKSGDGSKWTVKVATAARGQ